MKLKSSLIVVAGLALVTVLVAQTGQSSQSNSQSQSGNGTSSGSSSSSGRSWTSGSASGGKNVSGGTSVNGRGTGNGNGNGSGGGSGFGINGKPTHAIMYSLDSSVNSAEAKQQAFQLHTRYLGEQQSKGKVVLHGPWRDQAGSMAIIVALSDNEANDIARNDPAVKSGAITYEVRAWLVQAPTAPSSNNK